MIQGRNLEYYLEMADKVGVGTLSRFIAQVLRKLDDLPQTDAVNQLAQALENPEFAEQFAHIVAGTHTTQELTEEEKVYNQQMNEIQRMLVITQMDQIQELYNIATSGKSTNVSIKCRKAAALQMCKIVADHSEVSYLPFELIEHCGHGHALVADRQIVSAVLGDNGLWSRDDYQSTLAAFLIEKIEHFTRDIFLAILTKLSAQTFWDLYINNYGSVKLMNLNSEIENLILESELHSTDIPNFAKLVDVESQDEYYGLVAEIIGMITYTFTCGNTLRGITLLHNLLIVYQFSKDKQLQDLDKSQRLNIDVAYFLVSRYCDIDSLNQMLCESKDFPTKFFLFFSWYYGRSDDGLKIPFDDEQEKLRWHPAKIRKNLYERALEILHVYQGHPDTYRLVSNVYEMTQAISQG